LNRCRKKSEPVDKTFFTKPSKIYVGDPGGETLGSGRKPFPDPVFKKAPDSGSASLLRKRNNLQHFRAIYPNIQRNFAVFFKKVWV
jgi:hypothetical protein